MIHLNTQAIELDINKRGPCGQCVRVAQGESAGTTIEASVYDNGVEFPLAGYTAYLVARLPDRVHYYRAAASAAGNVATHVCDEAKLCSAPGYTDEAYFEFVKGEVTVQTERFALDILRSALEGQKPAESWDTEVADLLERGQSAVKKGEQAVKDAETAVSDANTAASRATSAASSANTAAGVANTAADTANTAANAANSAASNATTAASKADTATAGADTAKDLANEAAADARKAAAEARGAVSADRKLYLGYDGRYLSLYHIRG